MAAFCGVFDGHDGDFASEYCCQGIVPHIVAELISRSSNLQSSTAAAQKKWGFGGDSANAPLNLSGEDPDNKKKIPQTDMTIPYTAAFQKAHNRFCNHMVPPSFEEVAKASPLKVAPPASFNPMQWMATAQAPARGGTTACTMSVVSFLL